MLNELAVEEQSRTNREFYAGNAVITRQTQASIGVLGEGLRANSGMSERGGRRQAKAKLAG